jgi:hypothetical protein
MGNLEDQLITFYTKFAGAELIQCLTGLAVLRQDRRSFDGRDVVMPAR